VMVPAENSRCREIASEGLVTPIDVHPSFTPGFGQAPNRGRPLETLKTLPAVLSVRCD
jgi:hypothetical protein